jgi:hypothetical protein
LATAAPVTFVPPNEPVGSVFTTNNNDGWIDGRGIVFQMTSNETISSVGLFQDLTNELLSYSLFQTTGVTGDVTAGEILLLSGSDTVTTSGLEWIDFIFAPIALTNGNSYHLVFSFAGNSNQNFYYDNDNVTWTQGSYSFLDGTGAGDTINSVVGAFRLDGAAEAGVPEPSSIGLMLGGLSLLGWRKFAKR